MSLRQTLTLHHRSAASSAVPPAFADRADAGRQLGRMFAPSLQRNPVVIGLAKGGIVSAAELARILDATLDVVAVSEVHDRQQADRVIGAVAPNGVTAFLEGYEAHAATPATQGAHRACASSDATLHLKYERPNLAGREVILVADAITDGLATLAAARWAFDSGAARVIAAAPVASVEGLRRVLGTVTETVTLHVVTDTPPLSDWYRRLPAVDVGGTVELIAGSRSERSRARANRSL